MGEERSVLTGAEEGTCYYNDGVGCMGHSLCSFCGWNPKVYRVRVKQLRDMENRGETPHVQVQKKHPYTV